MDNGMIRNTRYLTYLKEMFVRADKPLSFPEIIDHVTTWKHGLTPNQLTNILTKCPAFTCVGKTDGHRSTGYSGPYEVNVWELTNHEDVKKTVKLTPECKCGTILKGDNARKSRLECGRCYLKRKTLERAKNGEK